MTSDSVKANIRKILAKHPIYCLNQFIFMISVCYFFYVFQLVYEFRVSLCVLNLLILSYTYQRCAKWRGG
jgi:hypothetical protein